MHKFCVSSYDTGLIVARCTVQRAVCMAKQVHAAGIRSTYLQLAVLTSLPP